MWCKNIAGRFFGLVTKHACDRRTDRWTDGRTVRQNYDSQDRASIAASRGKNTVSIPTKFCTEMKTTKCPSWVAKHTHNIFKMAVDRNRKLPYLGNSLTNFDEIWHGDAVWPSGAVRPLKIWNFKNARWRRPPSSIINKLSCGFFYLLLLSSFWVHV